MNTQRPRLLVIGGGNMGTAIVRGVLAANMLGPSEIIIAEPDHARQATLRAELPGLTIAPDVRSGLPAIVNTGVVWLAVKPQMFPVVLEEIRTAGGVQDRLVISIMAGMSINRLTRDLDARRVARVMPNLPASVGKGVSALCFSAGATPDDRRFATDLFRCVGEIVQLDESLMDAFTAVAGSGPAYLFLLAEALVEAAVTVGLERDTARAIVTQVLLGSSELLARETRDAAALRASVTSRGGTTAAALAILDQYKVREALQRAIVAARDRGRELNNAT